MGEIRTQRGAITEYRFQDEEVDPDVQRAYEVREAWLNSTGAERVKLFASLWNLLLALRKAGKYVLFLEFLKKKDAENGRGTRRKKKS